jgi:hypothetical protein
MGSKKEVGSTAGIAAIVVVIVHTLFPSAPESGGGRGRAQEKAGIGQANEKGSAEPALEGPWLATRAFFNAPPSDDGPIVYDTIKPVLLAKSLGETEREEWRGRFGLPSKGGIHSWAIVATVADPVHSRMQTFFDGQIQSIEKAVAMHGWEFATQWLPWRDHVDNSSGGIEERRRERQLEREEEAMPGVLVFRRSGRTSDALFVLLVPETPTKGIAGDAFYAALQFARVFSGDGCEPSGGACKTGLLAPSFSGSFDSLTRLLQPWDDPETIYKTVFGGSISSFDNAKHFEHASINKRTQFKFRSGIADSDSYMAAFDQVLDYYSIDHSKAAYWVEDESGFGAAFQHSREKKKEKEIETEEIPIYRFPREISHLRSAYQEATQGSRNTVRTGAPTLDFSLKDPSHGEDSIPVFSDTHTPVGQSAAISAITDEFRNEGTRMVFILAANTLDSLLLARFVRTESPNTRVLIGDADTLFIPAASQESLTGTLFLSTYPMFILGQEWLTRAANGGHGDTEKHLIFPSASHQGLFNVAQLLLTQIGAAHPVEKGDCLYGYRQLTIPSGGSKDDYPGLWLLTVTHSGFLPLNWFQATRGTDWFALRSDSSCAPAETTSTALEERFPLDPPSTGWYVVTFGISLTIILTCVWLLRAGYFLASERWFLPLLGAGLSLTAAQWILLLPAWRILAGVDHPPDSMFIDRITLAVAAIALIAPSLSLCIMLHRTGGRTLRDNCRLLAEGYARPGRARNYAIIIVAAFLWISAQWAWANGWILGASSPDALLFRMRAVQLFSDSSPALPMFVLSLIFSFGFVVYFLRYQEAATKGTMGRPDPGLDDVSITAVDKWINAPFSLDKVAFGRRLGICGSLVGLTLLTVWTGMFAFESPQFNCALYIAVTVVLFSLATACYDLIQIWRHLRTFLDGLEWGRQEAFERVTKPWPRRRLIGLWKSVPDDFFVAQLGSVAQDSCDVIALNICRYLVYAVRQMQRIALSVGGALVMLIAVLTAYSVQAPQLVGRFVAVLFLVIGGIVVWVFASMEKNWILSRIDRTEPGDLNLEFWMKATAVVAVPLMGVLVHLFPSIGGFVSSWLAPSLEALR